MKKMTKIFVVTSAVALLAACGSSDKQVQVTQPETFGGHTVQELQQSYNTVYFGFDRYDVDEQYVPLLDAQASYLIATPTKNVIIQGYTDERGTPEYNIALGQRRADAVEKFLEARGVTPTQLSTISYGEEKPAVLGHTEAAYAKNRRAVLAY